MNDIHASANRIIIRNIIVLCDILIAFGVMAWVAQHSVPFIVDHSGKFIAAGVMSMVFAQVGFSTVIHQHYASIDKVLSRTSMLVFTFGCSFTLMCALHSWMLGPLCNNKSVFACVIISYVAILASRMLELMLIRLGRKFGRNRRCLIFVGDVHRIAAIAREIENNSTTGLHFCGYYAPDEDEMLSQMMPYMGGYRQLEEKISEGNRITDDVYCALPPSEDALSAKLVRYCLEQVVHFYYVPVFVNEFGDNLKPDTIGNQVVFANFGEPLLVPANRALKRAFDIVCSGLALLVLLPFLPIIAIIIKSQSPGPIFFKQARTGMGGKDFTMLKFRSMRVNADADKVQATKNDPRKFAFGNFMRKTSIDELPQLWNIFIGDMSIVGPRPHMRAHTDEYRQLIDYYMARHYIRPGLTGWAQTTGYRGETPYLWQMEGRVKRDIWYIQNWSFWLDIRIIFRTAWQIFRKDKQAY